MAACLFLLSHGNGDANMPSVSPKDKNMIRNALTINKLALILVCWFALVGEAFGALSTTTIGGKTYYQIGSCQDLEDFSKLVNGVDQTANPNANAVLTTDFSCSGFDHMPIGAGKYYSNCNVEDLTSTGFLAAPGQFSCNSSKTYSTYKGTFDGQGYTISDLSVARSPNPMAKVNNNSGSGYQYSGLFGSIENATISNVVISTGSFPSVGTSSNAGYAGAIAGYSKNSKYY